MPRPKKVQETAEETLRRLALSLGLSTPLIDTEDEEVSREADAVVLYLENPYNFKRAVCRVCDRQFATTYRSVAMCSDHCRRSYFRGIGLPWDPAKSPEERWGKHVPLIVPPAALSLADEILHEGQEGRAL